MLIFSAVLVFLILIIIYIFTKDVYDGVHAIGGDHRSMGFNPDIINEGKMYSKAISENFVNKKSNLYQLIKGPIYVPQGVSVPLDTGIINNKFNNKCVNMTGSKNELGSMFMFAYNKYSPACCPSRYSTSRGCVCMTEDQKKMLDKRGN